MRYALMDKSFDEANLEYGLLEYAYDIYGSLIAE